MHTRMKNATIRLGKRSLADPWSSLVMLKLRMLSVTYAEVQVGVCFQAAQEKPNFTGRYCRATG